MDGEEEFHSQISGTLTIMDTNVKYHVTLESGRSFILNSSYDVEQVAWDAYDEACLMDDYLVNVEPINDI
tara:strand:- start:324 stop:533 length:210 start_codon:yes stop_codon:yes gene_type:complete